MGYIFLVNLDEPTVGDKCDEDGMTWEVECSVPQKCWRRWSQKSCWVKVNATVSLL